LNSNGAKREPDIFPGEVKATRIFRVGMKYQESNDDGKMTAFSYGKDGHKMVNLFFFFPKAEQNQCESCLRDISFLFYKKEISGDKISIGSAAA
jgi:hypothetical protein